MAVDIASQEASTSVSFWSPFRYKVFTSIWLAALFSDLGLWMQSVGVSWVIAKEAPSPIYISLVVTATNLPTFLLGLPAGALSDIFNKRKILLLTQGWMFLLALLFAFFGFIHYTPPVLMLLLSFLLAIGPAMNETAWQSVITQVVPPNQLPSAITLNGVSINLARAIGPAIGGLIISFFAPEFIFVFNAVCFLGTFIVVYAWSGTVTRDTLQAERFLVAMRAGVKYIRHATLLHPVFIRSVIFTIGASALWGLLPLVIIRQLHHSANVYGIMLFAVGGGAIVGAVLLPTINAIFNTDQKLATAICLIVANLLLFHFTTNLYLLFTGLFFAGIAWLMSMSGFNVAIQTNVPRWVLSRAISIYLLLLQGGIALGGIIWGSIATKLGVSYALIIASAWLVISLLLVLPYPLKNIAAGALAPDVLNSAAPAPVSDNHSTAGPYLIWIDYEISKENIKPFTAAVTLLKDLRLENGASQVGIFQNLEKPSLITEFFIVESLTAYQAQIAQYSEAEKAIEANVVKYHSGKKFPEERIMIAQA